MKVERKRRLPPVNPSVEQPHLEKTQPLPELRLPHFPHAYWHAKKLRVGSKKPVHHGPAKLAS